LLLHTQTKLNLYLFRSEQVQIQRGRRIVYFENRHTRPLAAAAQECRGFLGAGASRKTPERRRGDDKISGVYRLMQARMHGRVIDDAFWLSRHEV
jgi:hypothetical protein